MKSYLLPLAGVAGTVITLGLTAITLAAPADRAESPAAAQIRQVEQQNRLREWSQGLGVDLSDRGSNIARAAHEQHAFSLSEPASNKPIKKYDAHRVHDRRDHGGNGAHTDDDADQSRS